MPITYDTTSASSPPTKSETRFNCSNFLHCLKKHRYIAINIREEQNDDLLTVIIKLFDTDIKNYTFSLRKCYFGMFNLFAFSFSFYFINKRTEMSYPTVSMSPFIALSYMYFIEIISTISQKIFLSCNE